MNRALLAAAVFVVCLRIFSAGPPDSENDRSRWETVRALVEEGTYALGYRAEVEGLVIDSERATALVADVVLDPRRGIYLSSKPPLLATLAALPYAFAREVFGSTLEQSIPWILLLFNALPFALYLLLLRRLFERIAVPAATPLLAIAGFGTFVAPFASSLTNHVPAACFALFALAAFDELNRGSRHPAFYFGAGFAASTAAALELPAWSLVFALGVLLARSDPKRFLLYFLPGVVLPLSAFLLTTVLAFEDPWFFFRRDSELWFKFEGSYWRAPVGIDRGEDGIFVYVFHFLAGHHGVLSLTPIFILAFGKMSAPPRAVVRVLVFVTAVLLARAMYKSFELPLPLAMLPVVFCAVTAIRRQEALLDVAIFCTILTIGFYLTKTSNYGGIAAGPRWLIWLTPLWLLAMREPLEHLLAHKYGRAVLAGLSIISIATAADAAAHPWRHPWLYR
jgi:hypothetical protein